MEHGKLGARIGLRGLVSPQGTSVYDLWCLTGRVRSRESPTFRSAVGRHPNPVMIRFCATKRKLLLSAAQVRSNFLSPRITVWEHSTLSLMTVVSGGRCRPLSWISK